MAAGAAGGGLNLLGWIAGGCVAAAAGVGGLYYAGLLAPESTLQTPEEIVAAPAPTPKPTPAPLGSAETTPDPTPEPAPQDTAVATPDPAPVPAAIPQDSKAPADEPEPVAESHITEPQDTESQDAATATSVPQPQPNTDLPDLPAPRFDVVRVDPDGNTVIAGTGPAGARVSVLLDDSEQDSTLVDAGGAFVSLVSIPPSNSPRVLTLVAYLAGQSAPSEDQIILAPTPQVAAITTPDVDVEAIPDAATQPPAVATPDPAVAQAASDPSPTAQPATDSQTTTQAASETIPAAQPTTDAATTDTATADAATTETQLALADPSAASAPTATSAPVANPTPAEDAPAPQPEPTTDSAPVSASPVASDTAQQPTPQPAATPIPLADPVTAPAADPQTAAAAPEPSHVPTPTVTTTAPQSPGAVTVLRAGADGVEVLQSATLVPELLDKIALDAISYSVEGEVQLSGRAQGQSIVRIYLDNAAVADMTTDDRGNWSGKIEGIKPGIYTLRLDELDAVGAVLSRLETPFKRESPEALRPPQNSQGLSLDETPLIRAVTVQTGDTLWAISRERYGDGVLYVRVFEANRKSIRDPDLIYPGQVFAIPE